MPIPQVEKKHTNKKRVVRAASEVRKKRASARNSDNPTPRSRKKKEGKETNEKITGWRKIFAPFRRDRIVKTLWITALVSFGGIVIIIGGLYAWVSQDLADIEDIERRAIAQSTQIYASDGETLLYEIGDNRRADVPLDQIADEAKWATLALEDRDFYNHHGFKITSIVRAAAKGFLPGGTASATSTLTQQFIKNAVLTNERTYTRKIKELILAVRLEQKYEKDEILNMYLNEVYYGANYQGIEVASVGYFGKHASELSLAEAATLAALPQNPVILPRDPERLKGRSDYAIDQMVGLDYIEEFEGEAAKQIIVEIGEEVTEINAPHFVFMVREQLEETYGQNTIRRGGLKVTTTLDWDAQQKAEQAVADGIPKIEQYGGSNAALVSIDTHTGQIKALVGSKDFFDEEGDGQVNVATSLRQPGSSFKPIVYLAAFTRGYTPSTKVYDVETDFLTEAEGRYHPRNYDLGERGPVTLRSALAQSLNIPAVKTLYLTGVDYSLDIAERLGYTSLSDRSRFGLSLVLGGGEVSLLEHTSAYAAFSREGERHAISTIIKIEAPNGEVLEEWKDDKTEAVEPKYVRALNSVLSDSGARAGFSALNIPDRPVAAKTGTTNDYRDAWTMGYTPSLATGVWVGNNDNSEMSRGAAGLIVAAPIWNSYMSAALQGTPVEQFNTSGLSAQNEVLGGNLESEKEVVVDRISGELIPEECLSDYPKEYKEKKTLKETHTILYYLTVGNPTGGAPGDPRGADAMYEPWETAVVKWAENEERQNEYYSENLPKAPCNLRDESQQPNVVFKTPAQDEKITAADLSLSARTTPGDGRTITNMVFTIDDVVTVDEMDIAVTAQQVVTSGYNASSLTQGRHTATVRVTDDRGNESSATTNFDIQSPKKKKSSS